jgi:hypothetical protein
MHANDYCLHNKTLTLPKYYDEMRADCANLRQRLGASYLGRHLSNDHRRDLSASARLGAPLAARPVLHCSTPTPGDGETRFILRARSQMRGKGPLP